jgi:hypothetical protein
MPGGNTSTSEADSFSATAMCTSSDDYPFSAMYSHRCRGRGLLVRARPWPDRAALGSHTDLPG